jgi:hypothetical protein
MERTAQKTLLLIVVVRLLQKGTCLLSKLLLSNSCCIFTSLAVVVQQRDYMPHCSTRTAISSFPSAVLVTSVIGLALLPRGSVYTVITPNNSRCSLLKALSLPRRGSCFMPLPFMPLLRLGRARHFFSNIRPLGFPRKTSSFPRPWRPCPTARCTNDSAGHSSAGDGQIIPGPTTALGPFLRLSTALNG